MEMSVNGISDGRRRGRPQLRLGMEKGGGDGREMGPVMEGEEEDHNQDRVRWLRRVSQIAVK